MSRITALYDAFLRKVPTQSRSRNVVETILIAAADKLARTDDEERLTLQDVAQRAGVGIGSLYDYFVDRRGLLAALAAKLTEDNLHDFEQLLPTTHALPLEDVIRLVVDFCFERYASNKRLPRMVLKVAHSAGLMPTLAQSQALFAESLAAALRKRTDVTSDDVEVAAWTVTQAMMGVIHTLVWLDDEPHQRDQVRADVIRLFHRHLARIA
jgi:AcrR family transcriptional regulator